MNSNDPIEFENEVRRIARQLWPNTDFQGSAMLDGREHDGVFITDDNVHLVEATVSRAKSKASQDITKLVKQAKLYSKRYPDKGNATNFL